MSPALKSKTKNKSSITSVKEQMKTPPKILSASGNGGNLPSSAYNPISGTFHTLEPISIAASSSQSNGRFQHIDGTENHSDSPPVMAGEYDTVSNNDSCSGESEDPKDKQTAPVTSTSKSEAIPGCDNDKRERIRQKNEKKHQRQKERRAQELHERCTGFLMSRKLDSLTEKLVGMGFGVEHATRALMLNDGRAEDSVSWLLEGGMDEQVDLTKAESRANMKIDISDELAKIAELEIMFRCSKQDVERAVVSCEGDLEKAAEVLKSQKQDQATNSKAVKSCETVPMISTSKGTPTMQNPLSGVPGKASSSVVIPQPKMDERDLNYPKMSSSISTLQDPRRTPQPPIKVQPKADWVKNVAAQSDKRIPGMGSSPSVSYSLVSPLQTAATSSKVDPHLAMVGNEGRTNFHSGTLKEPVVVMQRPQQVNSSHSLSSSVGVGGPSPMSGGWNGIDVIKGSEAIGRQTLSTLSNRHFGSSQPFYPTNAIQHFVSGSESAGWGGTAWSNGRGSNSSLTAPSSLGLFTGGNTVGSPRSSIVDWSMIGTALPDFDYTSIDWSMDLSSSMSYSTPLMADLPFESWPSSFMSARSVAPPDGLPMEFMEGPSVLPMVPSSYNGSQEWTSPFTGKDIFRVPRKFVSSPSL